MNMRGNCYFLIGIMAIMVVIIGSSLGMASFKSKLLPIAVSSVVFILAAVALRDEIRKRQTAPLIESKATGQAKYGGHAYWTTGAWVIGFSTSIYLIGFLTASPLFIFAYMKSHGVGCFKAIAFAITTLAIIYGIFEFAVGITLYRGILFVKLLHLLAP